MSVNNKEVFHRKARYGRGKVRKGKLKSYLAFEREFWLLCSEINVMHNITRSKDEWYKKFQRQIALMNRFDGLHVETPSLITTSAVYEQGNLLDRIYKIFVSPEASCYLGFSLLWAEVVTNVNVKPQKWR